MMSNFKGGRGVEKNWNIEGKNRIKGGEGGQKWLKKIGHHLWMIPNHIIYDKKYFYNQKYK